MMIRGLSEFTRVPLRSHKKLTARYARLSVFYFPNFFGRTECLRIFLVPQAARPMNNAIPNWHTNDHLDNSGKRCNMGAGTPQLLFHRKPKWILPRRPNMNAKV